MFHRSNYNCLNLFLHEINLLTFLCTSVKRSHEDDITMAKIMTMTKSPMVYVLQAP